MTTPTLYPVVNIWRKDRYDANIGRGTPFGNPFEIPQDGDRDRVIQRHIEWLSQSDEPIHNTRLDRTYHPIWVRDHLPFLRGKTLGCFCAPKPCHGDFLSRVAALLPADWETYDDGQRKAWLRVKTQLAIQTLAFV
jgi:hypothetical protein